MGVAGTTVWRSEALTVLAPGQTMTVGPYTLRFDGVTREKGPNYIADRAHIVHDGRRQGRPPPCCPSIVSIRPRART